MASRSANGSTGGGFSLDAGVRIAATDRKGLERLLRYGARPIFASEPRSGAHPKPAGAGAPPHVPGLRDAPGGPALALRGIHRDGASKPRLWRAASTSARQTSNALGKDADPLLTRRLTREMILYFRYSGPSMDSNDRAGRRRTSHRADLPRFTLMRIRLPRHSTSIHRSTNHSRH